MDLEVRPGEMVMVMGGNGSGKSTLLRVLAGLIPITAGDLVIQGSVHAQGPGLRRLVGICLQRADSQIIASRVDDDVAFGPEQLGLDPVEIGLRVAEALEAVGLSHRARDTPHALSGGERQRLALAGVLALRPQCLCLDEPTSHLDAAARSDVLAVIQRVRGEGRAVVWVTHDPEEARYADRLVVLHGGRVIATGPPHAVWADEDAERWAVEPPAARVIQRGLCSLGLGIGVSTVLSVSELAGALADRWPGSGALGRAGAERPVLHAPSAAPCPAGLTASLPSGGMLSNPGFQGGRDHGTLDRRAALVVEELCHAYPDAETGRPGPAVLHGVSCTVAGGRCLAVLGASGSGKTTLGLAAAGLLAPLTGRVVVDGVAAWSGSRRTRRLAMQTIRERVVMVLQNPEEQFFASTVEEEIGFAARHRGWSGPRVQDAVRRVCEMVGLPEAVLDRSPFALSGGQERLAAIASVLVLEPRYLVLDEPTAGLDGPGRRQVLGLLSRLRDSGAGILLATHRLEDAVEVADEAIILEGGHVIARGQTRAVLGTGAGEGRIGAIAPVRLRGELCARARVRPGLASAAHALRAVLTAAEAIGALWRVWPPDSR